MGWCCQCDVFSPPFNILLCVLPATFVPHGGARWTSSENHRNRPIISPAAAALVGNKPVLYRPIDAFRAFNNCHTRVRPSGPNNVNSRPWTNGRPVGQRSSDAVPLVRLCLRFFLFLPSASFLGQRVGRLNKQKHCASDSLNGQFCGLVFVAHVHPTV